MSELIPSQALVRLSLAAKGLLTTALGLLGVFFILTLFYLSIRLTQRIHSKQ